MKSASKHFPTAALVWDMTHDLGYIPAVQVTSAAGNEVWADVTFPALDQVRVTFLAPTAGYLYLS